LSKLIAQVTILIIHHSSSSAIPSHSSYLVASASSSIISIVCETNVFQGAFWLSFAATLQPTYNAWGAYSPDPTDPSQGLLSVGFHSSFAFFFVAMAMMCFIYLICSLRTNVPFFLIFLTLVLGFGLLAGAYWQTANGNAAIAGKAQVAAGACFFVTSACGWWIFFAIMLAALDFPFQLPGKPHNLMVPGTV